MSARRRYLLVIVGWLVVVTMGSSLVWAAISRAGQDVMLARDQAVEAPGGTGEPIAGQEASSATPTTPSSSTPAAAGTSSPATPDASRSSAPTQPSSSAAPTSPSSSSVAPAAPATTSSTRRASWQGTGGYVSVECDGRTVSLVGSHPDPGFSSEIEERGPEEVKVKFEGQDGEERHTEVKAECLDGKPVFEVEQEGARQLSDGNERARPVDPDR